LPDRNWTLAVGAATPISAEHFAVLLEYGFRRMGTVVYTPKCNGCEACISLRLPVSPFKFSKSQRRVLRRNADVILEIGPPTFDEERLALYRKFLAARYPEKTPPNENDYRSFFISQLGFTREFRYLVEGRLVGLGTIDVTPRSTSSVYFYFDPDESWRSLGVFSILREIEFCRQSGREHVYLGFYVADCQAMSYKALYRPHERRMPDGRWQIFE
jgi:arginine-tRNA-protein transferase